MSRVLPSRVRQPAQGLSSWLLILGFTLLAGILATLPPLYALAGIAAAAALVGVLWLEAGYVFYLIGLYFVLFIKRITFNLPVGLALDGFMGLLFIGLLIRLAGRPRAEILRWRHPLVAAAVLYVAYQCVNAFNPNSLGFVFSVYGVRQSLPNIVLFMLTIFIVSTRRKLEWLLLLWFSLAAVVALYAVKQQFLGFYWREVVWMYSPEGQVWLTGEGVLRVFSFLLPDTTGITMAFAIILGLALLFAPIKLYLKGAIVLCLPIFGAAALYTGTRGAYAAAIVGALVVVVLLGRWWLYGLAALVVGLAATLVDWEKNYWGVRFLSVFNPSADSSYQVRQSIIGRYLDDALSRPFGSGTATTSYAGFAQDQFKEAIDSGSSLALGINVPTDNNYFQVLIEHGVVGEILLLLLLAVILFYVARFVFVLRDPFVRCLGIGLCGCFAAATVASVSNNYLNFWGTWLIFGLICVVDQLPRAQGVTKSDQVGARAGILSGGAAVVRPRFNTPPARPALPTPLTPAAVRRMPSPALARVVPPTPGPPPPIDFGRAPEAAFAVSARGGRPRWLALVAAIIAIGILAGIVRLTVPDRRGDGPGGSVTPAVAVAIAPTAEPSPTAVPSSPTAMAATPGPMGTPPIALPTSTATQASTPSATPVAVRAEKVAEVERALRSGVLTSTIDYGNGTRSTIDIRFDRGDAGNPRGIALASTYVAPTGSRRAETIAIGDRSWQRQGNGAWGIGGAQDSAWQQLVDYLPNLDRATDLTTTRDGDRLVLQWPDRDRKQDVTLTVDPATGIPLQLRRTPLGGGPTITVVYREWNTTVTIASPLP